MTNTDEPAEFATGAVMPNSHLFGAARFVACLVLVALVCGPSGARGAEDSCRLTSDQKMKAVKAFKALSPIFQDQRCLNCHGAVNPFTVDGGHPEYVDIVKEAKEFLQLSRIPNRDLHRPASRSSTAQ